MSGRWTVYVLLGLAIIVLLVLIVWLVRNHYGTSKEGFQQVKTYVELDTYMGSIGGTYRRIGVPVELGHYVCADAGYELSYGKCYPACRDTHYGVGDTCIPKDAIGTYPRTEAGAPSCPNGYEYSPVGVPMENCGGEGEPVCPPPQPMCLETCPDTMIAQGSKCVAPEPYDMTIEPYSITYGCDVAAKTRYVRIEKNLGLSLLGLSRVVVIDSTGQDVAIGKAVTASSNPSRAGEVNKGSPYQSGTSGWKSASVSGGQYWEVDLGAEYMIQAVCVIQERGVILPSSEYAGDVLLYPADRGADRSKINYVFPLTNQPFHNFRIYDAGSATYKLRAPELVQFQAAEYVERYPELKQMIGLNAENLYAHYNQTGRNEGRIPSMSAGAGLINGTTKARYIQITGKDEAIDLDGIYIKLVDGSALPILPSMVRTSGEVTGSSIQTNLVSYDSTKPGGVEHVAGAGLSTKPYIWIDLSGEYPIDTIRIKNTPTANFVSRLQGFRIVVLDVTKTMIYTAPLSAAAEQIIQVGQAIRPESNVCATPCGNGYTSVIDYDADKNPTAAKCRYKTTGGGTYTRAMKIGTPQKVCPYNGETYTDKYIRNYSGSIPECEGKPLLPMDGSSDLYYCTMPLSPIFITIREVLGPARGYCPVGYTFSYTPTGARLPVQDAIDAYRNNFRRYNPGTYDTFVQNTTTRSTVVDQSYTYPIYNRRVIGSRIYDGPFSLPISPVLPFSLDGNRIPFCVANDTIKYLFEYGTPAFIGTGSSKRSINRLSDLATNEYESQLYCEGTIATVTRQDVPRVETINYTKSDVGSKDFQGAPNTFGIRRTYTQTNATLAYYNVTETTEKPITNNDRYVWCMRTVAPTKEADVQYSCDPYTGDNLVVSPSKQCVRKLPADLATEAKGITVDYDLNDRCLYNCKHGFFPDYYNKKCISQAATFTRGTASITCPLGTTLDSSMGKCYAPCTGTDKPFGTTCYPAETQIYPRVGKDSTFRPTACPDAKPEQHADTLCYEPCRAGFASVDAKCVMQGLTATNYLNSIINLPVAPSMGTLPGLPAIQAIIYGDMNLATDSGGLFSRELNANIALGQQIKLFNPDDLEKYIRIGYDDLLPYTVNPGASGLCRPVVTQTLVKGEFSITVNTDAQPDCTTPLTPERLSLFSYSARNFIKNWVYNRTKRMIDFKFKNDPDTGTKLKKELTILQPNTYGVDIKDTRVLDAIAQAFYERSNGTLVISYIYDIFTIGSTMIDIRADIKQHGNPAPIQAKVGTLQRNYNTLITANLTEDILDQTRAEYQDAQAEYQSQQNDNVYEPLKGVTARFFYTYVNERFLIKGFSLDERAITSFIPQRNCGLVVPLGDEPGNVNYRPTTNYTKNPAETLNCTDPLTVKRIMSDYTDAMMAPNAKIDYPTGQGQPAAWDMSGALVVTEVTGVKQVTPYQCAYKWKETVYNKETNQPVPAFTGIERRAIMTYVVNKDDWYANDMMFDMSGFKFLTSDTVPECRWEPTAYKENVGLRTIGLNDAQAFDDYFAFGIKENRSLCPSTNPGLVFDPTTYATTNNLTQLATNPDGAQVHYKTTGKGAGLSVAPGFTLTPLATPIQLSKPLPAETKLDDRSGMCPPATCQDMKVLYDLVRQYNADPTQPGLILRITRAVTRTSMECHVEADIDWSATYDLSGVRTRKGGAAATAAGAPDGIQKGVTFSILSALDPSTCSYTLVKVGAPGSGKNIQVNTPALYKPMEFTSEAQQQALYEIDPLMKSLSTRATNVGASTQSQGIQYRGATYGAVGDLVTMKDCPTVTCSSPALMASFAARYKAINTATTINSSQRKVIQAFTKAGGGDTGLTCDYMFRAKNIATGNTVDEGARVTFTPGTTAATKCTFTAASFVPLPFTYFWSGAGTMANTSLSRASTYKVSSVNFITGDGFTDYVAPRPAGAPVRVETQEVGALREGSFGRDYGRNNGGPALSTMYEVPLKRKEIDVPAEEGGVAYKFLRFRPMVTRKAGAEAVAIQRVSFFYKGAELSMNGAKVSNPMGGWEGHMEDVVGAGAKGFRDDYKKPLVFAFTKPVLVDGFSFTTSRTETPESDPVRWKVEGSHNGTFWQVLSDQSLGNYPVPAERGAELPVFRL